MPMSPTWQIIKSNLYKIAYLENLTLRITVENVYKILFSEKSELFWKYHATLLPVSNDAHYITWCQAASSQQIDADDQLYWAAAQF